MALTDDAHTQRYGDICDDYCSCREAMERKAAQAGYNDLGLEALMALATGEDEDDLAHWAVTHRMTTLPGSVYAAQLRTVSTPVLTSWTLTYGNDYQANAEVSTR